MAIKQKTKERIIIAVICVEVSIAIAAMFYFIANWQYLK